MLQALWHRWRQSTTPSSPSGPDPVSEFLLQLRVAKEVTEILSPWQALMQTHPEGFTAAIEAAEEAGWPEHERLRLRAFGHFYRGELDEAFALAKDTALTFDNNRFDVDSFMLVIACLFHRGQGDDALRVLREIEAVHREPLHAQAVFWQSLAAIQIWRGALHEAWQALLQARTLAPQDIELLMTAYSLAFELGLDTEFEALTSELAATTEIGNALARATPFLARLDYGQGFALLEGRYQQADAAHHVNPALPKEKRFCGRASEYPRGKTLFLTCEQGFGDTLMMARYFPMLAELTANRLVIEAQYELLPLLAENFPHIHFIPRQMGQAPACHYDFWLGSLSLPFLFSTEVHSVPHTAGYLVAPREARIYWHERLDELAPDALRVGLAWSGNPRHLADRRRSLPFALLRPYLDAAPAGLTFVTLQTTGLPDALPPNLLNVSEELLSFADTAALIMSLDLVISVDTSVVHLAGALGKECWLLLPYRYEWRWGLEGEKNAWYDAVTVLRQSSHGNWESLLEDVFNVRLPTWRKQRGENDGAF